MARTIKLPTTQEIENLYRKGNIEQIRAINERLAKTANQRMAQLFKSNVKHSTALERAQYYLYQESGLSTGGVFSRSKKLDAETLIDQIREEMIFLRSKSSTVSGVKEIRARKSYMTLTRGKRDAKGNIISDPYLTVPEDIQVPKSWEGTREGYFQEKFLQFLDQDAWKDIKKFLYASDTNILAEAGEAIARGASIKDLQKAYRDYLKGETDIFTMWEDWTSVT